MKKSETVGLLLLVALTHNNHSNNNNTQKTDLTVYSEIRNPKEFKQDDIALRPCTGLLGKQVVDLPSTNQTGRHRSAGIRGNQVVDLPSAFRSEDRRGSYSMLECFPELRANFLRGIVEEKQSFGCARSR